MKVVLYTRSGCHLCDRAESTLLDLRKQYCFGLEIIDIDRFSELYDLYNEIIPVVCIDEKVVAKAPIDFVDLRNFFESGSWISFS